MEITPFYDKKIDCINCNHHFTTTRIRSRFVRIASHDTDFKPNYTDNNVNPTFYNVSVCPQCGFAFTDETSPYFPPGAQDVIRNSVTAKWNGRSFSAIRDIDEAIESYKLAYLSGKLKKEKPISLAGLTLRVAWLYRQKGQSDEEMRFLTIARDMYADSYSEGDYVGTQMTETRVLYLIAELSRRIGDEEEAVRGFSRVIEQQRTSIEPQIIEMAKERWREMRETKKEPVLGPLNGVKNLTNRN